MNTEVCSTRRKLGCREEEEDGEKMRDVRCSLFFSRLYCQFRKIACMFVSRLELFGESFLVS